MKNISDACFAAIILPLVNGKNLGDFCFASLEDISFEKRKGSLLLMKKRILGEQILASKS